MAGTGAAMRYEGVAMLNTGTIDLPVYRLMGQGFDKLDDKLSPKVDSTTYISDAAETKTVTSYAPEWGFDATVIKDDAVVTFLRNLGKKLATGSAAETQIVLFDAWDVDAVSFEAPAKRFTVAVSIDFISGGKGGEKLTMSGTLLAKGDPLSGFFDTGNSHFSTVQPVS